VSASSFSNRSVSSAVGLLGGRHSPRRSRLTKISCHSASRPIGLPQIRIEVGPRRCGGQVSGDSDRTVSLD
jgi:hypothetical protein